MHKMAHLHFVGARLIILVMRLGCTNERLRCRCGIFNSCSAPSGGGRPKHACAYACWITIKILLYVKYFTFIRIIAVEGRELLLLWLTLDVISFSYCFSFFLSETREHVQIAKFLHETRKATLTCHILNFWISYAAKANPTEYSHICQFSNP